MDGMIGILKEKGYTSHDVVARLRGILKTRRIGHTGTLDPEATGVLPVAVGAATKICDLFADHSKTYEAVIRLGVDTDTEDMTGIVLREDDNFRSLTKSDIESAVMSFLGEYEQVPPMYSALKVNGRKLYEYARAGEVIERKPRLLTIFSIKILWIDLPRIAIEVSCSKGTYIRTLSKDIAEKLGTFGCMEELQRKRVGGFVYEDCLTLSQVEMLMAEGRIEEKLIKVDSVFDFLDAYRVSADGEKQLRNGNIIDSIYASFISKGHGECTMTSDFEGCVRIYDANDSFIGVYSKEKDYFKPYKLFFINNGVN